MIPEVIQLEDLLTGKSALEYPEVPMPILGEAMPLSKARWGNE